MNPEKKFEAFLSCVIGDEDLKELLEDLIDSNVLSVIYPPVKLQLVKSGDSWLLKITDGTNSYVMHPNDIDDNMLQDITASYKKYAPEDTEVDSDTDSEPVARSEFLKRFRK